MLGARSIWYDDTRSRRAVPARTGWKVDSMARADVAADLRYRGPPSRRMCAVSAVVVDLPLVPVMGR